MPIDIATIKKVAHLARLELTPEEENQLSVDIEQILAWIDQLDEVNTEGVEPVIHMHDNINAYREDEPHNDLTRDEALLNAPQKEGGYFKVVKVI
ncbi:Asp-tRNA(Asn)/Glu-tRNA(Gln) amidotransferase subunit GatC [Leadbetterella sp. DM7]|uniref:Asp-tRNA(Asn)/Glu-tRNA(Gln) amidotransferase subunit GatC n=1 Tax=Leadbetterella sp. DM7 TaxID=3235085 RepID=UPI00349ECCC0